MVGVGHAAVSGPRGSLPPMLRIAFSPGPGGKLMASAGYANGKDDYFASIWDVASGKKLRAPHAGFKADRAYADHKTNKHGSKEYAPTSEALLPSSRVTSSRTSLTPPAIDFDLESQGRSRDFVFGQDAP